MDRNRIENEYFEWLYDKVCRDLIDDPRYTWRKLFHVLHDTEFIFSVPMDENRAENGRKMRWHFILDMNEQKGYPTEWWNDILPYMPCSVLEMMVRLSEDIENQIMSSTDYGDRTAQWFWEMIRNLGLNGMFDSNFDERKVRNVIDIFLRREYEPNGRGSLFWIRDDVKRLDWRTEELKDMRDLEIWHQRNLYFMDRGIPTPKSSKELEAIERFKQRRKQNAGFYDGVRKESI